MRKTILKTMLRHTPFDERRRLLLDAFPMSEKLELAQQLIGPDFHICAMPKTRGVKRGKYKGALIKSLSKDYEATGPLPRCTNLPCNLFDLHAHQCCSGTVDTCRPGMCKEYLTEQKKEI